MFVATSLAIVGLLVAGLQWNGLEINALYSAIFYVVLSIAIAWSYQTHFAPHHGRWKRRLGMGVFAGIILVCGALGTWKQYLRNHTSEKSNESAEKKTLHDLYVSDFSSLLTIKHDVTFTVSDQSGKNSEAIKGEAMLCLDFSANVKYLVYYLPNSSRLGLVCNSIADKIDESIKSFQESVAVELSNPSIGQRGVELQDLKFSGQVYIYHEGPLFQKELDSLYEKYKRLGLSVQFRDSSYAFMKGIGAELSKK